MNSPLKILHLEDSPSDKELIHIELARTFSDVEIVTVDDKVEFLKMLDEHQFDMILSDFHVPGFEGTESLEIVRSMSNSIPFIYVSGAIGETNAVELLNSGVTDYVTKDNLGKLPYSIKRALSEREDKRKRIEAERILIESERQYRRLFEKMNDGMLYSNSIGKIEMVNPSFCQMVGYEEDELVGEIGYDFLHNIEDQKELKTKLNNRIEGRSERYETHFLTKSGERVCTSISASPLYDEQGVFRGVMSVVTDITSQKEAIEIKEEFTKKLEIEVGERTKELNETKVELALNLENEKELNELKSRFVATVSHQFRTPLAVIKSSMGLLTMLQENVDDQHKPKFDRVYGRVNGQVSRMTHLMNDVLLLEKINSNTISPSLRNLDIVQLCKDVALSFNEMQNDSREMVLSVKGEPREIQLDPHLMDHAISNFISNAFKYSDGGEAPKLDIVFNPEEVQITIIDTGIGIPPDAMESIFDPFYRAVNVDEIPGTGLGTAIAKEYIELNGGHVEVKSEIGVGSEFKIVL